MARREVWIVAPICSFVILYKLNNRTRKRYTYLAAQKNHFFYL
jgi:hypothetical protein